MTKTEMLMELRRMVEERRTTMLDLIIGLDSMQREQEAEAKERLMAELRATDAFAAPADHTDYQPEGE